MQLKWRFSWGCHVTCALSFHVLRVGILEQRKTLKALSVIWTRWIDCQNPLLFFKRRISMQMLSIEYSRYVLLLWMQKVTELPSLKLCFRVWGWEKKKQLQRILIIILLCTYFYFLKKVYLVLICLKFSFRENFQCLSFVEH